MNRSGYIFVIMVGQFDCFVLFSYKVNECDSPHVVLSYNL